MARFENEKLLELLIKQFEKRKERIIKGLETKETEEVEGEEDVSEEEEEEKDDDLLEEDELPKESLLGIPFEVWVHHIFGFIGSIVNIVNLISVCKAFYIVGAHSLKERKINSRFAVQRIFEMEPSESFILKLVEWGVFDEKVGIEFMIEMCIKNGYVGFFNHLIQGNKNYSFVESFLYEIMELFENENTRSLSLKLFEIYYKHPNFNIRNFIKKSKFEIMNESFTPKNEKKTEYNFISSFFLRQQEQQVKVDDETSSKVITKHTNYFQHFLLIQDWGRSLGDFLGDVCENEFSVILEWILYFSTLQPKEDMEIFKRTYESGSLNCLLVMLRHPQFSNYFNEQNKKGGNIVQEIYRSLLFEQGFSYNDEYTTVLTDRFDEKEFIELFDVLFQMFEKSFNQIFLKIILGLPRENRCGYYYSFYPGYRNMTWILFLFKLWMLKLAILKKKNLLNTYFQKTIINTNDVNFIKTLLETKEIEKEIDVNFEQGEALFISVKNKCFKISNLLLDYGIDPSQREEKNDDYSSSNCSNLPLIVMLDSGRNRYFGYRNFEGTEEGLFFQRLINDKRIDPSRDNNMLFKSAKEFEKKRNITNGIFSKIIFRHLQKLKK